MCNEHANASNIGDQTTSPQIWACLLDTKGPEIRTSMLKDHRDITLEADQEIIIEAVGQNYACFEGYKNEVETRIGLSYEKLCQSISVGELFKRSYLQFVFFEVDKTKNLNKQEYLTSCVI